MDRDIHKNYVLYRDLKGHAKVRVEPQAEASYPLPHVVKHSPTGFEWGYHGSGPAELARCILLDWFGSQAVCGACGGTGKVDGGPCPNWCDGGYRLPAVSYQNFKRDLIADRPRDQEWIIRGTQIAGWLEAQ